ncbi:hypothetical protein D3C75_1142820 [compost metagenome]
MPGWIEEQLLGDIVIVVDVDVVDPCAQRRLDDRHRAAVERPDGVEHQIDAIEQFIQAGAVEHVGAHAAHPRPQLGG